MLRRCVALHTATVSRVLGRNLRLIAIPSSQSASLRCCCQLGLAIDYALRLVTVDASGTGGAIGVAGGG